MTNKMTSAKARIALLMLSGIVCAASATAQSLCINEIEVANIDQFIDPSYNYGGWIELYNKGAQPVVLSGYTIRHTDSEGNVEQSRLQASHGSVPLGGYAVIWFDHNSRDGFFGSGAGSQIPFKLDADGGIVELLDASGVVADAVEYPASIARCSWMRETDGARNFGWTNTPSPKASNNASHIATERLLPPAISTMGGTFTDSYHFRVDIPAGCKLFYTTDGSTPDARKSLNSADGTFHGKENAIYRFILTREGCLNSPVVTRSFFKTDVTFSLPILSVNTAPQNLFDNTIGLYVTGTNGRIANNSQVKANLNMDWERPVNVEYFVPDVTMNYAEAVNQEANFSIFGGWTRFNAGNSDFEFRSSFKLKSDKVFEGRNSFDYPLFRSKPYIKIKNFLVRNGGQDRDARITDGAIHELLRTSGIYIDCQAWQPTHVYLDGKYLGMMNLREESNKQFAFSNYGIGKDEMDQWEGDIIIKEGDKVKLDEWLNLSKRLSGAESDSVVWKQICDLVDIEEYCNYMAAEIYIGNQDWLRGGLKNVKGFRAKDDGGRFHLVLHDVDGCFGDTDMLLQVLNKGTGSLPVRFKNMLKWEPFRKQFIDTYCLMDGSVFEPERCRQLITAMRDAVNPALRLEGRSADARAERLISRIGDYAERRPALKQSVKTAFHLKDEYNVTLQSNTAEAKLLLNGLEVPTDRFRGYLFPPIALTSTAPDGYIFEGWKVNGETASRDSILQLSDANAPGDYDIEAVYVKAETDIAPIRINEVSAGNDIYINEYGKKADWIELFNTTGTDIDLMGAYLSDDPLDAHKCQVTGAKGVSTVIPAHGHRIVWCDGRESLTQLHASFKLKNADDAFVSITDANDAWADSLRYREQPRWCTYGRFPDGGRSLALFNRPTIDSGNWLCTDTHIDNVSGTVVDTVLPDVDIASRQVQSVRYYNLNGQRIANVNANQMVIQCIIYTDGTQQTRKILPKGH